MVGALGTAVVVVGFIIGTIIVVPAEERVQCRAVAVKQPMEHT